ncbi:hypothetical protein H261_20834 [Paramagnetospirillum caucaseum]|uniref:Uncharacterized protein n=1 Tax=Paramagnetospirillum caucaseum TaxID=1244869 RepID=M2Z0Z9_9PROT|nr:hypothetical protein [Paramagnetospirillum caucaseum]EME67955.1 hypothetical protein H261_20834 [Paramagnetospirillum caucaseum]
MYSDDDLDAATAAGILPPGTAKAFRDFVAGRQTAHEADEESVRLVTSFNDIFVTIAAVLLLSALGWLAGKISPVLGGAAVAAAAWAFAEYFTRRRRMALPSLALLLAFVWGVFSTGLGLVGVDDFARGGYGVAASAAIAALAAWGHWKRFMVPITIAAGAGAGAGALLALGLALVPALRDAFLPLVFVAGLALFALALWWDAGDLARKTRRSDVAFWLHLAAAPMIVHPVFSALGGGGGIGGAAGAVAVYLVLAVVALAVDRRALLVSALAYVLYAATALFEAAGSSAEAFALTALVVGSLLLSLSAFWHHVRRLVLTALPAPLRHRLPAA